MMMTDPSGKTVDLIRQGRFSDAASQLQSIGLSDSVPFAVVLKAEVLERIGQIRASQTLLERLLNSKKLDGRSHSRALTVRGVIALEAGQPTSAVDCLRLARELAQQSKALEELCWSELRLILAEFELSPTADWQRPLSSLRKHVTQLGDPVVTIALHLFVSEIEAKSGAVHSARRHLRIAKVLLSTYENRWLEGLASICEFCIAYLDGDLATAESAATGALRAAHLSGHARTELAAVIDIAHIRLRQGRLEDANRLFRQALRKCQISPRCKEYVFDGLSQLALVKGELDASERLMNEIFSSSFAPSSYPKLWSYPTRAKLLMSRGRPQEGATLCLEGVAAAKALGDTALVTRLRLLRAEAAAMQGDLDTAGQELLVAGAEHPDPSLELVAEWNRVAGRALVAAGDDNGARPALDRGARVLRAIGHLRAAAELESLQPPAPAAPPRAASRVDGTLGAAAALLDQAARPDLLAGEVTALLETLGCARASAIVATAEGHAPRVIQATGWSHAEAHAALTLRPPLPRVGLGDWHDEHWSLVVELQPTVTARSAFVAVQTLLAGARSVDGARREARERSALWPLDPIDDAAHGVFASEAMLDLVRTIRRIAPTPAAVLLTGETGTGKDVLARLIHEYSPRASRRFVPFNCTAVPREMLDSQLFGHRRGAFTGAQEQSPGVIRGAQGGTLFLDEIGEIAPELQVKLLRFLESSEVHPIGEAHPIQVDVRIIAATNADLDALVRQGRFREDLYYRLKVVPLRVPPLRERREEIPLLVEYYLTRFAAEYKKGQLTASAETMEYLLLHPWPGNVRQLANELRYAVALAEADGVVMPEHLQPETVAMRRTRPASERDPLPSECVVRLDQPFDAATEHLERALIRHAMTVSNGRMDTAAQLLGLSRKGLYLKRQRLGLGPAVAGDGVEDGGEGTPES